MFFDITAQPAFQDAQRWNREWILDTLQAAGISRVLIAFDGSGDSGQIERLEARNTQGEEISIPETNAPMKTTYFDRDQIITAQETKPLSEAIEDLCYSLLADLHGGWENDEGAFGEFTIDVSARTIALEYNERFLESISYNHTL
jgi:hypothetical protein